jgi:hypothetical protein
MFFVLSSSGALMLLAWFGFVFSAVYSARHLKEHWPNTTVSGMAIWFHVSFNLINTSQTPKYL